MFAEDTSAETEMNRTLISLILIAVFFSASGPLGTPADHTAAAARLILRFDPGWRFHLGDIAGAAEPGFDDREWRTIDLPHDWSIELPFDARFASGTGYLPGGIGWYRRSFSLPGSGKGKRASIRFDGVYMNSEVWVNGHALGKRPYGYVSFEYDLTPYLFFDKRENVIAVRVDHSDYADSRWYTGSGIYRHVWLTETNDIQIAPWGVLVTTPQVMKETASVMIRTSVLNQSDQALDIVLRSMISEPTGNMAASVETRHAVKAHAEYQFEQTTGIADPKLWSPDNPYLYSVKSRLLTAGKIVDETSTTIGIRTLSFDADKGFLLNGTKTILKGVCIHHDAGGLGAAVPDQVLYRRLKLLKEMGCNAIRTSHNPPAPELLDLCDSLGFLVMDEAFDEWAKAKKKWIEGWNVGRPGLQGYAAYFGEWAIRDIQSMVERDKNHPSIILWSIGNEIDYEKDPYYNPESKDYTPEKPSAKELPLIAAKLIKAVKDIDSSRPVTAALANITVSNRFGLADLLDVVGYNYLEKYYTPDHLQYPGRKMLGSENSHAFGAWKMVEDLAFANGQFLWTGFDYLGEARQWPARSSNSGVLDECGFRKPAYYFRQSLWSEKPMVYLAAKTPPMMPADPRSARAEVVPNWNWPLKDGDPVTVIAYTNCEKVELLLNGKSLGEKPLSAAQDRVLSWEVPFAAGTVRAVGKNGGKTVAAHELKTSGKPVRISMRPDATTIISDGMDLSHVEVSVVDDEGNVIYSADNLINFELMGKGRILIVDSGDIRSHESFRIPARKAYQGKCLVIVQSSQEAGPIRLRATSPGLRETTIDITAVPKRR
jgi:beta-galactosidase